MYHILNASCGINSIEIMNNKIVSIIVEIIICAFNFGSTSFKCICLTAAIDLCNYLPV